MLCPTNGDLRGSYPYEWMDDATVTGSDAEYTTCREQDNGGGQERLVDWHAGRNMGPSRTSNQQWLSLSRVSVIARPALVP